MASSSVARLPLLRLLLVVLLLLSSLSALAASEPHAEEAVRAPALPPAGRARQDFHVAAAAVPRTGQPGAGMAKDAAGRRPIRGRRAGRGLGGGTGAWAFSAMLPRRFVPPSGSSACHNDMPATVADSQFSTCGGAGSP